MQGVRSTIFVCGSPRGFHCSSTSGLLDHGHNMIICFTIPCMNMLIIAFICTMINHVSRNLVVTLVITAVYDFDVSCTVYFVCSLLLDVNMCVIVFIIPS